MVTPEQLADWQLLVDTIQMGEWRPSIFDTPGQQAIVALPEMMAEILLLQEQVKLAKAQRDSLQSSCFELATKLTAAAFVAGAGGSTRRRCARTAWHGLSGNDSYLRGKYRP